MGQVKRLGATILVGRLMMKPGKPAGVARLSRPSTGGGGGGQSVLVFCLPGNPVSALVCFKLIVVPALRKLAGHRRSALWSALCASLRRCARDGAHGFGLVCAASACVCASRMLPDARGCAATSGAAYLSRACEFACPRRSSSTSSDPSAQPPPSVPRHAAMRRSGTVSTRAASAPCHAPRRHDACE